MSAAYFEVRSSSKQDGEGERLELSRYLSRVDAEAAARRESAMGFFSQVFQIKPDSNGVLRVVYLCEYAPQEAA